MPPVKQIPKTSIGIKEVIVRLRLTSGKKEWSVPAPVETRLRWSGHDEWFRMSVSGLTQRF